MGTRAVGAVLGALLALSACGGEDDPVVAPPPATPVVTDDPCAAAEDVRACQAESAAPSPTAPPEGSAFWDALRIEPLPGQLRAVGNDVDVTRTEAAFSVTVRAGHRLGVQAVCEGHSTVVVETEPASEAAVDLACGASGRATEIGAEETAPVARPTTYEVRVSAPAPSRWFTTFYEVRA